MTSYNKSLIYEQLKILTILFVIAGHCFAMYSPDGAIAVAKESLLFELGTLVLYRFHVPCFFMVSGAIFALCLKNRIYPDGKTFVKKKAFRLLLPYLIFGILVVPPVLMVCGLLEAEKAHTFLWSLISGSGVRHLWYLYCLFLIFLLMWALRRFLIPQNAKKVLLVSFLVSLAFRSFSPQIFQYFQIANTFYYQFFFVCGIYLDHYFEEITAILAAKKKYLWLALLVLCCSAFADFWTLSGYVYALCGMTLSLWVAVWISRRAAAQNAVVVLVGKNSYGIYLFHAMIVYLIFYAFSSVAVFPVILVCAAFFVSLFVSVLLAELCRRAGLGFVMGEGRKRRG